MATWNTPKTDWLPSDGVLNTDINRIEENLEYLREQDGAIFNGSKQFNSSITVTGQSVMESSVRNPLSVNRTTSGNVGILLGNSDTLGIGELLANATNGGLILRNQNGDNVIEITDTDETLIRGELLPSENPIDGSFSISAGVPFVIPRGTYLFGTDLGNAVEVRNTGTWRRPADVSFLMSDGTNVRINSGAGITARYLKF